jgi:galactokinase
MNAFEMAFAIVALVMIFKLIRVVMIKNTNQRSDSVNTELAERLNQVEERVRVLERIVTDDRTDLRQQFKDLES